MMRNTNQELYDELLKSGCIYPTNIKAQYANNTEKSYLRNKFYNPSNSAFNLHYLNSKDFIEDMAKNPLYLGYLPEGVYSENDVWDLISNNFYSVLTLDESYLTDKIYTACVMRDPRLIGLLPDYFQTTEIIVHAIKKEPMVLEFVRDDLLLFYICKIAVQLNWEAIKYVPTEIIDDEILSIVLSNNDAFILDKVDHSKITQEVLTDQLSNFPIQGSTYLVDTHLIEDVVKLEILIHFMSNLTSYSPKFFFKNCDPQVLLHHNKKNAFCALMQVKPDWIQYLDPSYINEEIFQIALKNNIRLELDSINYRKEFFGIIYHVNKKAFIDVPLDRISNIGDERVKDMILEAIEDGWFNEIPSHFFTKNIIKHPELSDILPEYRKEIEIVQDQVVDFDLLLKMDCSVDEYLLLSEKIPSNFAEQFIEKHIESYAGLKDADKTKAWTISFLSKYPNKVSEIPHRLKEQSSFMQTLLEDNMSVSRHLSADEILEIYSNE